MLSRQHNSNKIPRYLFLSLVLQEKKKLYQIVDWNEFSLVREIQRGLGTVLMARSSCLKEAGSEKVEYLAVRKNTRRLYVKSNDA